MLDNRCIGTLAEAQQAEQAAEVELPRGMSLSRRESETEEYSKVLLVSATGRHRAIVDRKGALERSAAGVGKFKGHARIHELPSLEIDKNTQLSMVSEYFILDKDGHCRHCSKVPRRCRPIRVSVFEYFSTQHGQGVPSRIRVTGKRHGSKEKFHNKIIRAAAPTLEEIRKDRREMLARPSRIPYEHKFLGQVNSFDVQLCSEEFDELTNVMRNYDLVYKEVENRIAGRCRHAHPSDTRACGECVQKGVAAADSLRAKDNNIFRRLFDEQERNPRPKIDCKRVPQQSTFAKRVVDLPWVKDRIHALVQRRKVLFEELLSSLANGDGYMGMDQLRAEFNDAETELRGYYEIIKKMVAPNPSPFSDMRQA